MNNFFTRLFSAIVFVTILIGCVTYSSYTFLALFLLISMGSLFEFYKLISLNGVSPNRIFGFITGAVSYILVGLLCLQLIPINYFSLLAVLVMLIFIFELYSFAEKPFINIGSTITGLIYTVMPFCFFVLFGFENGDYQWQLVLGYLILQWSSDTGQYCFGMVFGKRKLFQRISPGKSWEGFIGGFAFTLFIGWVISKYYLQLQPWQWITMGGIIVVSGTLGDLSESLLKRSVGVKDSGKMMPGHGGFLDRFDAMIGSAPFVYAFIKISKLFL